MKKNILFGSVLGSVLLSSMVSFADDHKTVADVADKAFDAFLSVSAQIKSMAPELWAILLRQQYVKAVGDITTQLSYMAFVFVLFFVLKKTSLLKQKFKTSEEAENFSRYEEDAYMFKNIISIWVPAILYFIMALFLIHDISHLVRVYMNPEYYAMFEMMDMVKR